MELQERGLLGGSHCQRISILIVSYNTREMTLACIRSIYEQAENRNFEIIVVDNQSTDGSAEAIQQNFPNIQFIRSNENLGFARANNLAATEATGDYILLLNPDTVVLDHAIDRLVTFAKQHPEAKIWGGRTVFEDGSLNPTSCWRRMTNWSLFSRAFGLASLIRKSELFNFESYGGWDRDTVRQVDIITGCFFLTTRQFWEKLGGFDPDYFMYGEEADLCLRAYKLGARPVFTRDAEIIHFGRASETVYADKVVKLFAGKLTLIIKHWPPVKRLFAVLLFRAMPVIRVLGYSLSARLFRVLGAHKKAARYENPAREWIEVWKRRNEWLSGYPTSGPVSRLPTGAPRSSGTI